MRALTRCLGIVSACLLVLQFSARADDGVIEINHARALQGGVSTGDLPGYPITLGDGHFRLTGPLAPAQSASGAVFTAEGTEVRIDMAGFAVSGGGSCSFSSGSLSCTAGPVPTAFETVSSASILEIRNGFLQGFEVGVARPNTEVWLRDVTLVDVDRAVDWSNDPLPGIEPLSIRNVTALRSALFDGPVNGGAYNSEIRDVAIRSGEISEGTASMGLVRRVAMLSSRANVSAHHVEQWVSSGDTNGQLVTNNLHRSLIVNGTGTGVFARLVTDSVIWGNSGAQAVLSTEALANSIVTANPAGDILGSVVELGDNVCGGCP